MKPTSLGYIGIGVLIGTVITLVIGVTSITSESSVTCEEKDEYFADHLFDDNWVIRWESINSDCEASTLYAQKTTYWVTYKSGARILTKDELKIQAWKRDIDIIWPEDFLPEVNIRDTVIRDLQQWNSFKGQFRLNE